LQPEVHRHAELHLEIVDRLIVLLLIEQKRAAAGKNLLFDLIDLKLRNVADLLESLEQVQKLFQFGDVAAVEVYFRVLQERAQIAGDGRGDGGAEIQLSRRARR